LGVLEVYSRRAQAFDADDGQLIQTLASQAAIAITNARLIEELARSRGEQTRAAEAERALREIAARMTAMRDQDEILKVINDEAAKLLRGSGAMINLTGDTHSLNDTWIHLPESAATIRDRIQLLEEGGLEEDAGVSGLALRTREVEWTDDYLLDERFAGNPILVTVPLFTFVGYVLAESKAPERIVRASVAFFGWLPGGLAIVCIIASAFFTNGPTITAP